MVNSLAVHALLLDMDGVFYVGDQLIDGANGVLAALRNRKIPFRFITNTTTRTPAELVSKLDKLGLTAQPDEIFTAVSATERFLAKRGKPSCYLLLRESVKECFRDYPFNDQNPDFVIIGDIGGTWDYATLNRVFNMLMNGSKLICMHRNKYFQTEEGLQMDIGAFVAALEHVSNVQAVVIGKPAPAFFQMALDSLGVEPEQAAIIGDDIESDIGGGQAVGLQGILVKTGKYRDHLVAQSSVKPDCVIESIAALPELLR